MKHFYLDGNELKGQCHAYIKEALQLPEYYGKNLDALYDCLCDMGEAEITVERQAQAAPEVLAVLKEAEEENPAIRLKLLP